MYFQGVTDVFEIFFASFINVQQLNTVLTLYYESDESDVPDMEFIFEERNVVLNYGVQILDHLYQQTEFEYRYFNKINDQMLRFVDRYDPQLCELTQSLSNEIKRGVLLKSSISFGLHTTNQPKISTLFAIIFMKYSIEDQAFILQCLQSVACRIYAPYSF